MVKKDSEEVKKLVYVEDSKDVEKKLNEKQREYLLHEQLKVIKKELGLETDSKEKVIESLR